MILDVKKKYSNFRDLFKYPDIRLLLSEKRELYFFCHAWSFGGAERVHIDILNVFRAQNPICFITDRSKNEGFRKEFESAADVVNLGRWAEKKAYKEHLSKKIAGAINRQESPVVLGCNSPFMYSMLHMLEPHVRVIDLIHNFSDGNEGAEWYSLPYVPMLEKRIVVGYKLVDQFKTLYLLNSIPKSYLDRFVVIGNKVNVNPLMPVKNYGNMLEVVFVARNSYEKRPGVFIKIAELCQKLQLPIIFTMIGNFGQYQKAVPDNITLAGEIHDKGILNVYYERAHILLLTSYREGMPLVVLEGMSFGVVPLATNVGELSRFISNKKGNGILLENVEDEEKLAELFVKEIIRLNSNRKELETLGKKAFSTIRDEFSEEDFVAAYKAVVLNQK